MELSVQDARLTADYKDHSFGSTENNKLGENDEKCNSDVGVAGIFERASTGSREYRRHRWLDNNNRGYPHNVNRTGHAKNHHHYSQTIASCGSTDNHNASQDQIWHLG